MGVGLWQCASAASSRRHHLRLCESEGKKRRIKKYEIFFLHFSDNFLSVDDKRAEKYYAFYLILSHSELIFGLFPSHDGLFGVQLRRVAARLLVGAVMEFAMQLSRVKILEKLQLTEK